MPNYFVTFRAHSAEPEVFEDWMILLSKIFEKQKSLAWQIEWDETPSRHIHLLLFNIRDNDTITQMWNGKAEKQFRDYLKSRLTNWEGDVDNCAFCKVVRVDDKDPKNTDYYTGYIHKHSNKRGKCHESITSEHIMECVNYYYVIKKMDSREQKNNNIRLINSKNIYQNLISFVENPENETGFDDPCLKYKTVKIGNFGYSQVSQKQQAVAFTELRIMNNCEEQFDKINCQNDAKHTDQKEQSDEFIELQQKYNSLYNHMHLILNSDDIQFAILCAKKQYHEMVNH